MPRSIRVPSSGCTACKGPARLRILGRELATWAGMWRTTNPGAAKSAGMHRCEVPMATVCPNLGRHGNRRDSHPAEAGSA